MELRELLGYFFLLLAIVGAAGGIWAAWYYSPARSYGRQLHRERHALRKARTAG